MPELAAFGLVAYGFHEAWPPAGFIVGGIGLWVMAIGLGRR